MEQQILDFILKINSPELQAKLFGIKLLFLSVTGFFIAVIVIALARTPYISLSMIGDAVEIATFRPFGFPKMRRRWQKIMQRLDADDEAEYKLAIIEADTLLDEMLKKMRLAGNNVDERLEKVTLFMLTSVEELKVAHRTRSSIVYDVDYRLSLQEARRVLLAYQKAFEQLDFFH